MTDGPTVAPQSRFRPRYRKLEPHEVQMHDDIKEVADDLAKLFDALPKSRETSLAMTNLEQAVMWAVKGLTA